MPIKPEEIKNYREKIDSLSREDALKEIAELNAEKSLPVVIKIFGEMLQSNENLMEELFSTIIQHPLSKNSIDNFFKKKIDFESEIKNFLKTEKQISNENVSALITNLAIKFISEVNKSLIPSSVVQEQRETFGKNFLQLMQAKLYLLISLRVYREADEWQNANKARLGIRLSFERYNAEKVRKPFEVVSKAAQFITFAKMPALIEEAEKWVRGLYRRTLKLAQDNKCIEKNAQGLPLPLADGTYPVVDEEDESFKKFFKTVSKYDMALYHLETADVLYKGLTLAKTPVVDQPAPSQASVVNGHFYGNNIGFFSGLQKQLIKVSDDFMPAELAKTNGTDLETQLCHFKYCLDKFQLTADQKDRLACMKEEINVKISFYAHSTRYFFWWQEHKKQADEFLEALHFLIDPLDQLNKLFELRNVLRQEQNKSQHLLPIINELLLTGRSCIVISMPVLNKLAHS